LLLPFSNSYQDIGLSITDQCACKMPPAWPLVPPCCRAVAHRSLVDGALPPGAFGIWIPLGRRGGDAVDVILRQMKLACAGENMVEIPVMGRERSVDIGGVVQ